MIDADQIVMAAGPCEWCGGSHCARIDDQRLCAFCMAVYLTELRRLRAERAARRIVDAEAAGTAALEEL